MSAVVACSMPGTGLCWQSDDEAQSLDSHSELSVWGGSGQQILLAEYSMVCVI